MIEFKETVVDTKGIKYSKFELIDTEKGRVDIQLPDPNCHDNEALRKGLYLKYGNEIRKMFLKIINVTNYKKLEIFRETAVPNDDFIYKMRGGKGYIFTKDKPHMQIGFVDLGENTEKFIENFISALQGDGLIYSWDEVL